MLACLALLSSILFAQDAPPDNEVGVNLGWGHPFGMSLQYSRAIAPQQTLGIGAGFSLSGARCGVDYKYLFNNDSRFNPYLGMAGSFVNGLEGVKVNADQDTATYDLPGGFQVTPRCGFRYRSIFASLYLNIGYGIPPFGGGARHVSGPTNTGIRTAAQILGMGGTEVSGSVAFGF